MADAGLSIGGIGSIGLGNGMTMSIGSIGAAPGPAVPAISITATASAPTPSVVVSFSDAAMRALALDAAAAANGTANTTAMPSKLMDDLVAATLLAILQRDQQQNPAGATELSVAAAAINAYLAAQALGSG
ncbi:MAG: hypothetical protein PHY45_12165 [Rhodocyclaceae bacterium]|nr:hypothetical protein [Rhodocyclaceae bacterium]